MKKFNVSIIGVPEGQKKCFKKNDFRFSKGKNFISIFFYFDTNLLIKVYRPGFIVFYFLAERDL